MQTYALRKGGGASCAVGDGGYESNYEGYTASFLPGPTPNYNAIKQWLSYMSYEPGCALRVIVGSWSKTEGKVFIDALARVDSLGCKVDFIHGAAEHETAILNYVNGRFEVEYQKDIHAKMILWQGPYKGHLKSYAWVGSWNATYNAVRRNDENLVRIEGSKEFKAYWDFFQHVEWDD